VSTTSGVMAHLVWATQVRMRSILDDYARCYLGGPHSGGDNGEEGNSESILRSGDPHVSGVARRRAARRGDIDFERHGVVDEIGDVRNAHMHGLTADHFVSQQHGVEAGGRFARDRIERHHDADVSAWRPDSVALDGELFAAVDLDDFEPGIAVGLVRRCEVRHHRVMRKRKRRQYGKDCCRHRATDERKPHNASPSDDSECTANRVPPKATVLFAVAKKRSRAS